MSSEDKSTFLTIGAGAFATTDAALSIAPSVTEAVTEAVAEAVAEGDDEWALSAIEALAISASSDAAMAARGSSEPKPLRVSSKKAAGLKYRIVLMASIDFEFNGLDKMDNAQT